MAKAKTDLVIVESPSKATTIKKFLGSTYEVVASNGHVRDLPKSTLGIDIENDFEPKYITIRGKGDILAKLRKEAKKADKVYLATDPDREGEAISYHLSKALKLDDKKYKRITFNEITKNAVKNSIKQARDIDMALVDAQQARRVLDRLVGYKISPLLWAKIKRGLSAGRVQSVALKLICDREKEIYEFIPKEYWTLSAMLAPEKAKKSIEFKYMGNGSDKEEISSRAELDQIIETIGKQSFKIASIKDSERHKKAPLPFTTSTLQQEASSKLNFATSKTMRIAQQLYEGVEIKGRGSIGLISYLATYARINEYGFIEAPYRAVDKETGKVAMEATYMTADEEDNYHVAQANEKLDAEGHFVRNSVSGRYREETQEYDKSAFDYMDVSPKMVFSVATALIPFLQNDDPTRALMGSNMQRQAVPLLTTEAPVVGTGIETKAAVDSGVCVVAKADGEVLSSESNRIIIKETDGNKREYILTKFSRSNQSNCYNQRPIVFKGDKVKAGDVIADGPSTSQGELALGKNPLIGFMTWEGYNYEDAVLLSERLVEYDVYTSVHIEEYEVESRDTKLGPEEITRDVPGVGDDALKDLDERGIIRVGAEVRAGDILVGKVTPKGETELTAEERLLRAIFGEKAREVRDTSLKVPHGAYGIIVDAKVFTRENGDELSPGVNQSVRIYIAQKRKISVGDKMAGRHGNKGVVSRVLPVEDMPFLPNGRPLDIVLNPLGVPSRMNIGQVLEIHLSLAAKALGFNISTPVFDGANEVDIEDTLELANDYVNLPFDKEELEKDLQAEHPYWSADAEIFYDKYVDTLREDVMEYLSTNRAHRSLWKGVPISKDGKVQLRDGRTGECFDGKTTIGHMHYLKLHHLVDDKIHARSTGPYSLVTQQPLGGKAQFGGQRFGEMEVWALEAYGAAYTLQEILTMKSDDVVGRVKTYEAIIKGENIPEPGIPESFKVLLKELQALGLDVKVLDENREEVELIETSEYGNTDINSIIGNDKDYAFEDSESFAEHGFSKKEFDDNEELVDIEEEESPETADDDIFADEVLDDEE